MPPMMSNQANYTLLAIVLALAAVAFAFSSLITGVALVIIRSLLLFLVVFFLLSLVWRRRD